MEKGQILPDGRAFILLPDQHNSEALIVADKTIKMKLPINSIKL